LVRYLSLDRIQKVANSQKNSASGKSIYLIIKTENREIRRFHEFSKYLHDPTIMLYGKLNFWKKIS